MIYHQQTICNKNVISRIVYPSRKARVSQHNTSDYICFTHLHINDGPPSMLLCYNPINNQQYQKSLPMRVPESTLENITRNLYANITLSIKRSFCIKTTSKFTDTYKNEKMTNTQQTPPFNLYIYLPHHHPLPHTSLNPSTNKLKHPPSNPFTHTPLFPPNITIKYISTDKYTYISIHLSIHSLHTTTFHNTHKFTTINRT